MKEEQKEEQGEKEKEPKRKQELGQRARWGWDRQQTQLKVTAMVLRVKQNWRRRTTGEDGIPAVLSHVFADIFVPRILMTMEHLAKTGRWGEGWARGIMRTIPKEAGNLAVDKQIPMTLLNAKAKWVTGTMKICLEDFLNVMVPMEQKGFMKGRNLDAHLYNVMYIQSSNVKGAWVSIDFLKAYDKMGHQIIEALLNVAGMDRHCG